MIDFTSRLQRLRRSGSRKPPSLLMVTLPKSGSIFMLRALSETMGLQQVRVSPGYFPEDHLDDRALNRMAQGGQIGQAHINPSGLNLALLEHFAVPWFLHVRDPRGALLSWTHHFDRILQLDKPFHLRTWPTPPLRDYMGWPFERRLDWQIEHFYPGMLRWLEQWADALEARPGTKVTRYRELAGQDSSFIAGIAKCHLGRQGDVVLPERSISASHFRSGRTDEWREVFTADQIAAAALPPVLASRFDWEP